MAYTRINWKDFPDTTTPITANNLNRMDSAIESHDESITTNTSNISSLTPVILWKVNPDIYTNGWKTGNHNNLSIEVSKFEFVDVFGVDKSKREYSTRVAFPDFKRNNNLKSTEGCLWGFDTLVDKNVYTIYEHALRFTLSGQSLTIHDNFEIRTYYSRSNKSGNYFISSEEALGVYYTDSTAENIENDPRISNAPIAIVEVVGWWK